MILLALLKMNNNSEQEKWLQKECHEGVWPLIKALQRNFEHFFHSSKERISHSIEALVDILLFQYIIYFEKYVICFL